MFRINQTEYRQKICRVYIENLEEKIEIGKTRIVQPELRRIFGNKKKEIRGIKTECRQNVDGNKMDQFR